MGTANMIGSGSGWSISDITPVIKSRSVRQVLDSLQRTRDLSSANDAELVRQTNSGNPKAFEALVRRYQKLVYNVVFQMVRTHESASDLTQETFIKAYRALPTFQTERNFKPWLLKIATNSALNILRDGRKQTSLDEMLENDPYSEPVSGEDLETEVEWRVTQQSLFDALGSIPLKQREVFVLRYQQDLCYDDIAEVTGTSVSSVKSLLFRARETLKKLLAEEPEVSRT